MKEAKLLKRRKLAAAPTGTLVAVDFDAASDAIYSRLETEAGIDKHFAQCAHCRELATHLAKERGLEPGSTTGYGPAFRALKLDPQKQYRVDRKNRAIYEL